MIVTARPRLSSRAAMSTRARVRARLPLRVVR